MAAAAAGLDPRALGGRDLAAEIEAAMAAGAAARRTDLAAWGIIALRAAGRGRANPVLAGAAGVIERAQRPDGGWAPALAGGASDPVDTATAVQGLAAAGRPPGSPALVRARVYLRRAQRPDGAFALVPGGPGDALATSWAAVALAAAGVGPAAAPRARAIAWLRGGVRPDGGPPPSEGSPPVWVAAQTALALSGATLPVRPAAGAVAVDHDPRVIGRDPADGQPVAGGPVIVRYRDEDGGSGIDVGRVRLWVGGRDVTPLAEVTPFGLQLAQDAVPAGAVRVALVIADRAGNVGRARWTIVGPREAQGR